MFYVAGERATLLIISASLSLFNESSNFETSKFKLLSSVIINQDNFVHYLMKQNYGNFF